MAVCALVATLGSAGVGAAQAQWWVHERLVEGLSIMPSSQYAFVNPFGTAVFFAVTSTGGNVFVGSRNFSLEVLGGFHSATPYGVTDDGRPIWTARNHLWVGETNISQGVTSSVAFVPRQSGLGGHFVFRGWNAGREKVYVGTTDLTTQVLGEDGRGDFPSAPNPSGQVAWRGRSGTDSHWDIFVDGLNVSSFLGPGRYVAGARLDDSGQVAWIGQSPSTGNRMKVFVGTRDITTESLGVGGEGALDWMNRRGDVVWRAYHGINRYVMLNTTNVSFPVVGGRLQLYSHALSEEGHVLWSAVGPEPGRWRLFRDSEELNTNVIGFGSAVDTLSSKMNATGHVLWAGGWSDLSAWGVYYDTFNLTRDAFGLDYVPAFPLAIGDGGHCLWYVERGTYPYATYDVYLSTPVPEPGGALVTALGFLGFLRRARRSA